MYPLFQATGRKMINCACSASLKLVVIGSSSNQMHASSNLPSVRTKKVGTLVTSLYVSTLYLHAWWGKFRRQKRTSLPLIGELYLIENHRHDYEQYLMTPSHTHSNNHFASFYSLILNNSIVGEIINFNIKTIKNV
jgi:hypothetical protein